jgi:shikimate dehydrogenase
MSPASIDRYAVFGQPIAHSKSPRIHSLFAQQTGQSLLYTAQAVTAQHFSARVDAFFAEGGCGLNCTVPLKELAYAYADRLSERAQQAKAVNTLMRTASGDILGDNTDGIGLLNDLTGNLGLVLAGQRILILGAGGATRGILAPLLERHPHSLFIANRTQDKAHGLQQEFRTLGTIDSGGFDDLNGLQFDLIINATSASLSEQLPPLPHHLLADAGACYDLAYAQRATAFVRWGRKQNARISADGLGMLVEQAAEAFWLWRDIKPQTKPIIDLLNQERE